MYILFIMHSVLCNLKYVLSHFKSLLLAFSLSKKTFFPCIQNDCQSRFIYIFSYIFEISQIYFLERIKPHLFSLSKKEPEFGVSRVVSHVDAPR